MYHPNAIENITSTSPNSIILRHEIHLQNKCPLKNSKVLKYVFRQFQHPREKNVSRCWLRPAVHEVRSPRENNPERRAHLVEGHLLRYASGLAAAAPSASLSHRCRLLRAALRRRLRASADLGRARARHGAPQWHRGKERCCWRAASGAHMRHSPGERPASARLKPRAFLRWEKTDFSPKGERDFPGASRAALALARRLFSPSFLFLARPRDTLSLLLPCFFPFFSSPLALSLSRFHTAEATSQTPRRHFGPRVLWVADGAARGAGGAILRSRWKRPLLGEDRLEKSGFFAFWLKLMCNWIFSAVILHFWELSLHCSPLAKKLIYIFFPT